MVDYPDLTHFGPLQAPDRLADDVAMFMLGIALVVATIKLQSSE